MLFVDLFIVVNRQNLGFVGIGITWLGDTAYISSL